MKNKIPILKENHSSFRLITNLNELCKPLFQHTIIDTFAYARLYPNGLSIMLDTHAKWHEFLFMKQGLDENQLISYDSAKLFDSFMRKRNLTCLTAKMFSASTLSIVKEFNLLNAIGMLENNKERNYYEYFEFASYSQDDLYSWHMLNSDKLEKFKIYFREYGKDIIITHERDLILMPKPSDKIIHGELDKAEENLYSQDTLFYASMQRKVPTIQLTSKERQFLLAVKYGNSAKEIAKTYEISYRTVEKHLESVREKLKCNKINSAIYKAKRLGIL